MVGDIDRGMEEYARAVNDESRTYIDFGNVRAMSRAMLPMSLVEEIEHHPRFRELMKNEGIDDAWQAELIDRLNEISNLTGIVVRADE
jgi:ASC-1-like (ASCH) protein